MVKYSRNTYKLEIITPIGKTVPLVNFRYENYIGSIPILESKENSIQHYSIKV